MFHLISAIYAACQTGGKKGEWRVYNFSVLLELIKLEKFLKREKIETQETRLELALCFFFLFLSRGINHLISLFSNASRFYKNG